MALNDVKEIAIPEGSVKQIQDSNGNIIWGSQAAFPYRRLEYIKLSGNEFCYSGVSLTGPNAYKRIDATISYTNANKWSYSGYIGNNSNICFGTRPNNLATLSLGAVNYGTNSYTLSLNTKYTFILWVNAANNNSLTISDESGTTLWTSSKLNATWTNNTGQIYIGAANQNNSPVSYTEGKLYSFIIRQPGFSNIVFNGIPCQRKSDGKCGLYDITTGVFRQLQGTVITDAAAGPTVDEYWNLQA